MVLALSLLIYLGHLLSGVNLRWPHEISWSVASQVIWDHRFISFDHKNVAFLLLFYENWHFPDDLFDDLFGDLFDDLNLSYGLDFPYDLDFLDYFDLFDDFDLLDDLNVVDNLYFPDFLDLNDCWNLN